MRYARIEIASTVSSLKGAMEKHIEDTCGEHNTRRAWYIFQKDYLEKLWGLSHEHNSGELIVIPIISAVFGESYNPRKQYNIHIDKPRK